MRGRKPKPTALKLVTGNPGKRRLPKREPKPKRVIPSPPAHLSGRTLVAWGAISAKLDRLRMMTELEDWALEQLCENYVEILELRDDVAKNGRFELVERTTGQEVQVARAAYVRLADAERRFRAMMSEFGLTPSSRSRVTATPDDDRNSDPAQAYFG